MLSADQVNQPDVISIMGASSALLAAGIPFEGPLAGVRVVRDESGEFIVNPSFEEAEASDLDLVVAGSKDAVYMLEAGAHEVSEEDMLAALMFAQEAIARVLRGAGALPRQARDHPDGGPDPRHRPGPGASASSPPAPRT